MEYVAYVFNGQNLMFFLQKVVLIYIKKHSNEKIYFISQSTGYSLNLKVYKYLTNSINLIKSINFLNFS